MATSDARVVTLLRRLRPLEEGWRWHRLVQGRLPPHAAVHRLQRRAHDRDHLVRGRVTRIRLPADGDALGAASRGRRRLYSAVGDDHEVSVDPGAAIQDDGDTVSEAMSPPPSMFTRAGYAGPSRSRTRAASCIERKVVRRPAAISWTRPTADSSRPRDACGRR